MAKSDSTYWMSVFRSLVVGSLLMSLLYFVDPGDGKWVIQFLINTSHDAYLLLARLRDTGIHQYIYLAIGMIAAVIWAVVADRKIFGER